MSVLLSYPDYLFLIVKSYYKSLIYLKSQKTRQKSVKNKPVKLILQENKFFVWGMIAAFLVCTLSVTTHKIEDDDLFWHLAGGRFIVENGSVPDKDVFGYPTVNAEWIPFEWGWDVISYGLYKAGGYNLISVFSSLIFILIFFLCFRILGKLKVNSVISLVLLFTLLIAWFNRLSPRPHIFTYLFLTVLLYLILCYKYISREKYFKLFYALPIMFLIWGNLHLGALTGIALLLVFIISESVIYFKHIKYSNDEVLPLTGAQLKKLLIILVCSSIVLFINPHGLKTYTYAYNHTNMKMLESIGEWLSPFSSKAETGLVLILYKVLLFLGLIIFIYAYKKRDLTLVLICAASAIYSLRAIRFTIEYELIAAPLMAISIDYFVKKLEKSGKFILRFLHGNALKVILTAALLFLSYQFQTDSFYITLKYNREAGFGISSRFFPVDMVKFIKDNNIKGSPFNGFDTGGYLMWEIPGQKIFIDSRNINDDIFFEYMSIYNMQPGYLQKLDNYGIDYAYLFEPKLVRFPNILKQTITAHFFSDTNWALVYWDDEAVMFLKRIPKYTDLISKYEYKVFNPYTAIFERKKFEESIMSNLSVAQKEMQRKVATEPWGYFFQGMNDIAQNILRTKNP